MSEAAVIYAFGQHELDEARFELRREGRRVELQPKALELLFFLVRNHGRALSKEELLDAVWPDSVVTDNSLARAVRLARVAIGDETAIATVPRRGYRFASRVRALPAASAPPSSEPRYIGRAKLLARLGEALDAALAGSARVLLLVGEAGIGKTRTAELVADRARQTGAIVAAAWGVESPAPTYALWSRVLRALSNALPDALSSAPRALQDDLAPLVSGRPAAPNGAAPAGDSRFRLFTAVQELLAAAAARRPLVLVLDDLHGVDAESLWLLEFVGQALRAAPIAIIATCREEEIGRSRQQARALERLLRLGSLQRWPLVGLPDPEVCDFVRAHLDGEPDPALVAVLARRTGGNPLLLGESLRSLDALGRLAGERNACEWEALLPAGIQHLMRPKLLQLSAAARDLLACAVALGLEFERALLERCAPDPSRFEPSLGEALEAGLLRAASAPELLRFSHPLVHDALGSELLPRGRTRRAAHARIASVLEDLAGGSAESLDSRAHHACEAAPLVAPARAAELAREAGTAAARLYEFERAAEWLARALSVLELEPDPALRLELQLALGDAHQRSACLEWARTSYREALHAARSLGRNDLFARAALGLAHEPGAAGNGDAELVQALEEAARGGASLAPELCIRVRSRLGSELRHLDPGRANALVDAALADARALGDPSVLARALEDCLYVRFQADDPRTSLALSEQLAPAARAAGELELMLLAQRSSIASRLELGDAAAAERGIRACVRTADTLRTPYARWHAAALRAMQALLVGELEAAERDVVLALQAGERLDEHAAALQLPLQLAYLRLEQGRAAEIEPGAREQMRLFPDALAWRAGHARLLVAAGRTDEARAELAVLAQGGFANLHLDRGWLMTLALAAEVALATGDVATAELLQPLLAPCAELCVMGGSGLVFYGPVHHHLGLLALACGRREEALAHFDAALAIEERCRARIWHARTQLASARALLAAGEPPDARVRRLVAEAAATARALGLTDVAADAARLAV